MTADRNHDRLPVVWAGMNDLRTGWRLRAAILSLSLVLAACGGGAGPSPSPIVTDPPDAPVTAPPNDGGGDGGGGVLPPDGAKVVVPRPGQLDVHPVSAESITAKVDGRNVVVGLDWWSGVEPCSILDTVVVERQEMAFVITLREGRGPEDVACIMIAELHRTFVDLGELEPGTYTIRDGTGGAPDIEVVVG
jgi:hypothetical protein